jgi:thiosulfate/3-mercaptopyruvate sulfurtransferase
VSDILVTTQWLNDNLSTPNMVVLDCTWHLPESGKKGSDEFVCGHIPGARFIDLTAISDAQSPFVNMMPSGDVFAREASALGIGNDTNVIVYDSSYVSARVWWMFRCFGLDTVRILDGGWRKWLAEGRPVEKGEAAPAVAASFRPTDETKDVAGWQTVLRALQLGSPSIVDARTPERFSGAMPSGYPGVPGGHIPSSVNIPWSKFYNKDFTFVGPETARALFVDAGVDPDSPVLATCGSGVTAAILVLMLERMGQPGAKLYDGSWHEWAQQPDLPKASLRPFTEP